MAGNFENLLQQGAHITEDTLFDYSEGKLSAKESHEVEKHLLECELCNDTLEGMKLMRSPGSKEIISDLNKKIDARIESFDASKGKIVPFKPYYRIAAVIALFILFGGSYWFLKNATEKKMLAENKPVATNSDSIPVQIIPQGNSDQKAATPITTKPQFSLSEKTPAGNQQPVISQPTISSSGNQITENDIEKNKDDNTKQLTDNELLRNKNSKAEEKETSEGFANQSSQPAHEETRASKAAPSAMEAVDYYVDVKANKKERAVARESVQAEAINSNSLFSTAKANYDQKKYAEAANDFEKILNDTASSYYDDAKWLLANCYSKTSRNAKARKLLREIAHSNSIHKKEAEGLLQESQ